MKILIDNGHGSDTPGKYSPDGRLHEYSYCRMIASGVVKILKSEGYDALLLTPESIDIPLCQRVSRANMLCSKVGSENVILVSIHNNAAGADGKWHNASGSQVYVAPIASKKSHRLAAAFADCYLKDSRLKGNRHSQICTGNFAIIRDTKCAAVLTENLFQDNREDVRFMLSDEGLNTLINCHLTAIRNFLNEKS